MSCVRAMVATGRRDGRSCRCASGPNRCARLREQGEVIMAAGSWHDKPQDVEIDKGMARTGAAKRLDPLVIHEDHAMRARLRTPSIGGPPTGAPPDASSPLPTDPEKQHGSKTLPVPRQHWERRIKSSAQSTIRRARSRSSAMQSFPGARSCPTEQQRTDMSPRKMVSLKADIPPSKAVAAQETVGTPNKLGVYVHGGKTLVGRVGRKATAVDGGAVRFALREARQGRRWK